jgi:hypothetical protein
MPDQALWLVSWVITRCGGRSWALVGRHGAVPLATHSPRRRDPRIFPSNRASRHPIRGDRCLALRPGELSKRAEGRQTAVDRKNLSGQEA